MVVRMKHTKGKRNRVRSHHALLPARFSLCSHCGKETMPHQVCRRCGYYRDRKVIDVLARMDKKGRKEKESRAQERR